MINLQKIRKENNFTQQKLADLLKVSRSTVAMWESGGSEPDNKSMLKIAEIFNVSLDRLLGRIDNNVSIAHLPTSTVKIPVLGKIPAGVPIEAIEDVIDYIDISEDMLRGGREFFALKIAGDSMHPKYLDGDTVIFEKADTCDSGAECAVMVNGDDATFKKIEIKPNGIMLKPLNPNYEAMFYTNDEAENKPVRIIGIAREVRREV